MKTRLIAIFFGCGMACAQALANTITLVNENFGQGVLVEVQVGGKSQTRKLEKGGQWPIPCPQGVAEVKYRSREDANEWGTWHSASCGVSHTYRISDGGIISSSIAGGSSQGSRTLTPNAAYYDNANKAVRVSDASLEIANGIATLRFRAESLLRNVKFVGTDGPALFVTLIGAEGRAITQTGGQMAITIDVCNQAEQKTTTLRGVTPAQLNAATTFSLRMSGASGSPCQ